MQSQMGTSRKYVARAWCRCYVKHYSTTSSWNGQSSRSPSESSVVATSNETEKTSIRPPTCRLERRKSGGRVHLETNPASNQCQHATCQHVWHTINWIACSCLSASQAPHQSHDLGHVFLLWNRKAACLRRINELISFLLACMFCFRN